MRIYHTVIRSLSKSFSAVTLAILISGFALQAQDGEKLFKANCASCHKIDKKLIGPALAGIEDRWESKENLYAWIKNSSDYLKNNSGDSYAQGLFEEYNKSIMTAQALSDAEIDAILAYVANPPASEAPKAEVAQLEGEPSEDYSTYWLLGLAAVLLLVIKVLSDVKHSLKSVEANMKDEKVKASQGFLVAALDWISANKKTTVALMVVILATMSVQGWFVLKDIGVYQGYSPEQPIKFSHKIHAGDNEIDCGYCHHSAYKGKNAGIPSVNVCMNCHAGISEGKVDGPVEIAKIYEAAGWDPEQNAYTKEQKPIKWVRIHNLPDFTYFNHSQHVVVGEQKCQTCHGEVQEFGYPMKQFAPLTMGWCVECHRETEVAMEGNAYYDKIHEELLERYKDKGIEKFSVEHIGGLECAKCHY
ncbi:MAG: c-type cytochrome [Flavobacteriales bacterium]|nr:c-type cytochrome [Flavobacteriales bacterium]